MPLKRKKKTPPFFAFRKVGNGGAAGSLARNTTYLCGNCLFTVLLAPEFSDTETLFISEVSLLLEHRKSSREEDDEDMSEVFQKTLEYTQKFSRFNNRETISAVRR